MIKEQPGLWGPVPDPLGGPTGKPQSSGWRHRQYLGRGGREGGLEVKEDDGTNHSNHCGVFICQALCCTHHPILQMSKLRLRDIKSLAHSPTVGGDRTRIQNQAVGIRSPAGPRAEQSDG